jgi:hypothetical protein
MISVSKEEMNLANEDPDHSVALGRGRYLASLGVFHELHCIVSALGPFSRSLRTDLQASNPYAYLQRVCFPQHDSQTARESEKTYWYVRFDSNLLSVFSTKIQ